MSAVQVSQRLSCREIDLTNLELRRWVRQMQSTLPGSVRDLTASSWLGLFYDEQLFAAISYVHRSDQSVFIDGLVCRPNKLGRKYAVALWMILRQLWKGRRVSFCVSLANRKMLRALKAYTAAKPVAAIFEMEA